MTGLCNPEARKEGAMKRACISHLLRVRLCPFENHWSEGNDNI